MSTTAPIFLYTDFGSADIYVGQVKAVLHAMASQCTVIDLLNDAPRFQIVPSAHLLAALVARLPTPSVTVAVVDPGVGSARSAVALEADGRWFVGPDNGLLSVMAARAVRSRCYRLEAAPQPAAASFHGRDVFAPAAAHLARGTVDIGTLMAKDKLDVELGSADLPQVVYIDHYGNAMTGIRAASLDRSACLEVSRRPVRHARVFSDVPPGSVFWYENSIGLVEIAVNQADAATLLGLSVGIEIGCSHDAQ